VAAGSPVLYGCAAHPVDVERGARPVGHIVARPGRAGFVVAAPHGTSDPNTGHIAADVAARVGFGLVVATGFTLESAEDGRPLRRYQVNRPLEGMPGHGPAHEHATPAARRIYEEYEARVRAASGGPLAFYVEIHGNGRKDTAGRIEIATVGIDGDEAVALKRLLGSARDAELGRCLDAPALDILVEPADSIFYRAGGAKRDGILRLPERALHLELPRAARREFRQAYTEIIAAFVAQAAALGPPR
jgi:hypothetical protein